MSYFRAPEILKNPYAPVIALTLYSLICEAFMQMYLCVPEQSSAYFDISKEDLRIIIEQLPKFPLIVIGILLVSTKWLFTEFTTVTLLSIQLSLCTMFLIERG